MSWTESGSLCSTDLGARKIVSQMPLKLGCDKHALSWTVPDNDESVACDAPCPRSLVRPLGTDVEDMMILCLVLFGLKM